MSLSEIQKHRLLIDADYRCEYCKRKLHNVQYEIDHISPLSSGGQDVIENYAVSCPRCNRNKGSRTYFIDPHTRNFSLLFNPRNMKWENHFLLRNNEVVGTTPEGRATCALLMRSTPQYLPPDLKWDLLEGLEDNENLYLFLNRLRFHRLQNEFEILENILIKSQPNIEATEDEIDIYDSIQKLLLLELLFTRSTKLDIERGISIGKQILKEGRHTIIEIERVLSILYQQRATLRYLKNDTKAAKRYQRRSQFHHRKTNKGAADSPKQINDLEDHEAYLRNISIGAKFSNIDLSWSLLHNSVKPFEDSNKRSNLSYINYLVDVALIQTDTDYRFLETLYSIMTEILETSGYGSTFDHAGLVSFRRRWWVLHFILEMNIWNDAFIADIKYWIRIKLFNEVRELRLYVVRIQRHLGDDRKKEIDNLFREIDISLDENDDNLIL